MEKSGNLASRPAIQRPGRIPFPQSGSVLALPEVSAVSQSNPTTVVPLRTNRPEPRHSCSRIHAISPGTKPVSCLIVSNRGIFFEILRCRINVAIQAGRNAAFMRQQGRAEEFRRPPASSKTSKQDCVAPGLALEFTP